MKFKHFFLGWRTPAFFIAIGLPAAALAASQPEGVGNFQKVDDHVYRGAQPTEQGFKNLATPSSAMCGSSSPGRWMPQALGRSMPQLPRLAQSPRLAQARARQ